MVYGGVVVIFVGIGVVIGEFVDGDDDGVFVFDGFGGIVGYVGEYGGVVFMFVGLRLCVSGGGKEIYEDVGFVVCCLVVD